MLQNIKRSTDEMMKKVVVFGMMEDINKNFIETIYHQSKVPKDYIGKLANNLRL
jgi:hypothetical protein